jgi:metallo-beta-lactamase family protein
VIFRAIPAWARSGREAVLKIRFLGGAGTVTGSKFLVTAGGTQVLVDCGLFQGFKVLRERNWRPLPFTPGDLDAVVLTHAHLDHSGSLPVLVRAGFRGPIHCTEPTADLCGILLPDAGYLQEEDARYRNKKRTTRHDPALPLFTEAEAQETARRCAPVAMGKPFDVGELRVSFRPAGHILGAASVLLQHGSQRVLFSGDLGRPDDPLLPAPDPPGDPDWIVMEGTYGDELHQPIDPVKMVAEVVRDTAARGGVVLIPAFAVGRAQAILYFLHEAFRTGLAPRVPVFVNSPMATRATALYPRHARYLRLSEAGSRDLYEGVTFVRSVEESKELNTRPGPHVIVSASGMLTGGRVLHHLATLGSDPRNGILLAGFQAPGTRGAALVDGARSLRIHGHDRTIRARVHHTDALSAHADQAELLAWLRSVDAPPRGVFLVHGEPAALDALRLRVGHDPGFAVSVAEDGREVDLGAG